MKPRSSVQTDALKVALAVAVLCPWPDDAQTGNGGTEVARKALRRPWPIPTLGAAPSAPGIEQPVAAHPLGRAVQSQNRKRGLKDALRLG